MWRAGHLQIGRELFRKPGAIRRHGLATQPMAMSCTETHTHAAQRDGWDVWDGRRTAKKKQKHGTRVFCYWPRRVLSLKPFLPNRHSRDYLPKQMGCRLVGALISSGLADDGLGSAGWDGMGWGIVIRKTSARWRFNTHDWGMEEDETYGWPARVGAVTAIRYLNALML